MIKNMQRSFGLVARKREQDQEKHGRCSAATVQPKNVSNGNSKMPSPSFFKEIVWKRQRLQIIRLSLP